MPVATAMYGLLPISVMPRLELSVNPLVNTIAAPAASLRCAFETEPGAVPSVPSAPICSVPPWMSVSSV